MIKTRGMTKVFRTEDIETTALRDVDLEIEKGDFVAVMGPSGCGKTTALRLISGFERPDQGSVEINGREVASSDSMVPPERRKVGLVFQALALFPHLSVRDNVAYGIRRDPDHPVRVDELLEMVGLVAAPELAAFHPAQCIPGLARFIREHPGIRGPDPKAAGRLRCRRQGLFLPGTGGLFVCTAGICCLGREGLA